MFAWLKSLFAQEPPSGFKNMMPGGISFVMGVEAPLSAHDYPHSLYRGYWELHDNVDGTTQVRIYDDNVLTVEKLMRPSEVAAFVRPLIEATRRA
jgi:hypothetical protein